MEWKRAFQTDTAGRYNGETAAWKSPLEDGVYLLPAGATFTPPPDPIPQGKWARFNGTGWDLISVTDASTPALVPNPADDPAPAEIGIGRDYDGTLLAY